MARSKKTTEADANDVFSLKTSELLWMRDKFISGLSNLESGVRELRRAYISHFNTLLPDGHPGRLPLPFFTSFDNNAAGPLGNVQTEATPAAVAAAAGVPAAAAAAAPGAAEANSKKKRKKHDPNAPKRALTSYFLFMQHNKPQIKELHPEWDAKQVAEESERRWNSISEQDKQKYEYMYQVDLARYYRQKEAYEAGEPIPVIDADEAQRLYNEHLATGLPFKGRKGRKLDGVQPPADFEAHAPAASAAAAPAAAATTATTTTAAAAAASDSDSEEEAAPTAPPPAKRQRKQAADKSEKPTPKAAGSAKKFKEVVPAKSPEVPKKKAGRKSKAADETPAADPEPEPSPKKETKKPGRKRKSAAAE